VKILVTGSAGQVGSYLVEHLRDFHDVVGIDLRHSPIRDVDEVTAIGDIRKREDVKKVIADVDAVVHCAAQVSVVASIKDPLEDESHNITGTLVLLEEAAAVDVERFVYFSSAAVYGNPTALPISESHSLAPLSPYGVSKLAGEKYTMAFYATHGLKATALRPFNIYSPRQDPNNPYSGVITRFRQRIREKKPPLIYGTGEQTRDFIHVKDVVEMVDLLLKNPAAVGTVFNCATGESTSIKELAEIMLEITGADALGIEYADPIPGEIMHSRGDITLAREVLGFYPRVSLRKGLEELLLDGEEK